MLNSLISCEAWAIWGLFWYLFDYNSGESFFTLGEWSDPSVWIEQQIDMLGIEVDAIISQGLGASRG
jgi:hypothetical protein